VYFPDLIAIQNQDAEDLEQSTCLNV